jgi:hypothetical protein
MANLMINMKEKIRIDEYATMRIRFREIDHIPATVRRKDFNPERSVDMFDRLAKLQRGQPTTRSDGWQLTT